MGVKRYARTAELIKTLVLFDGPQLALLRSDRDRYMLAVACKKAGYSFPFFSVEVGEDTLRRYLNERIDLNYAMRLRESFKKYYFFDWKNLKNMRVPVVQANLAEVKDSSFYPDPGFFARTHTSEYSLGAAAKSSARQFQIDGSWDAGDFSRFYSKIADIYAFALLSSKELRSKVGEVDTANIKNTISHQAWKGGGSYVSFYSQLFASVHSLVPLNISKIQYESPGYIELTGGEDSLADLTGIVYLFDMHGESLKESHDQLRGLMEREGLLGSGREKKFSGPGMEAYANKVAGMLANSLGVDDSQDLYEMCGSDTAVFCKVILSYYRRARDLHKFYAEGRVSL